MTRWYHHVGAALFLAATGLLWLLFFVEMALSAGSADGVYVRTRSLLYLAPTIRRGADRPAEPVKDAPMVRNVLASVFGADVPNSYGLGPNVRIGQDNLLVVDKLFRIEIVGKKFRLRVTDPARVRCGGDS